MLYHAKFGGDRTTRAGCRCENFDAVFSFCFKSECSFRWCEVYSSLKGDLFEISMFYSGEECLIETLEPVFELPQYGLMPTIENKIEKYM